MRAILARWITSCVLVSVCALAAMECVKGAEEAGLVRLNDIAYKKVGGQTLKLDLARPEGDGPFPAVIVIHGGAWRMGGKEMHRDLIVDLARRGYVAVAPDYRLCPKSIFPAQVLDVKRAVQWLKTHAKEHRVDPDRIGAVGFSAGAHLALMLGVTGPKDGFEQDEQEEPLDEAAKPVSVDSRVRAVVSFFAPTDLAADDVPDRSKPLVKDFLGGTAEEKPSEAVAASPITFVTKDDAPVLAFHGTGDPIVPYSQALKLSKALTAAGVAGRVELLIGMGHGWGGSEQERTMQESFSFLDEQLKKR